MELSRSSRPALPSQWPHGPLAEAALSDSERDAVERLLAALRERFDAQLRAVWLYRSRARGESGGEYSNVDLLVITDGGRARDLRTVSGLAFDAAMQAGVNPALLSTVVMSPERIRNRREIRSFFIQEVDRDKIVRHRSALE